MIAVYFLKFSEENITYIYPDMRTVLIGKFKDGVMIEGRPAKILAERCNDGLKEIRLSKPDPKSPVFTFKRNNRLRIYEPTIMDPFEKSVVYIRTTEGRGDGLFARRDIDANEVVSYYGGNIFSEHELREIVLRKNQTGYDR